MNIHRSRRSSSELKSVQIICRSRGKRADRGLSNITYEQSSGGMGLAPHLVCKTSVTVKDLPAEKRLVALIRCRGGFDSYCPSPSGFNIFSEATAVQKINTGGTVVTVALPRDLKRSNKEMQHG